MDIVDFVIYEPGWETIYREVNKLKFDYMSKAARARDHEDHTAFRGSMEAMETLLSTLAKLRRDILKEP